MRFITKSTQGTCTYIHIFNHWRTAMLQLFQGNIQATYKYNTIIAFLPDNIYHMI